MTIFYPILEPKKWKPLTIEEHTSERLKVICPNDISYSELLDEIFTRKLVLKACITVIRRNRKNKHDKEFDSLFK